VKIDLTKYRAFIIGLIYKTATHINRDTFDTDRNRSLPSGRRLGGV